MILIFQSRLVSAVLATSNTRISSLGQRQISQLFANSPDLPGKCCELILAVAPSDLPHSYFVLLSLIVPSKGKDLNLEKIYVEIVKLFCAAVLGSRVCPDHLIIRCCAGLFKQVTRDVFKEYLLPAILKALLRNPDELTPSKFL